MRQWLLRFVYWLQGAGGPCPLCGDRAEVRVMTARGLRWLCGHCATRMNRWGNV